MVFIRYILILLYKVNGAGKRNLRYIFNYLIFCHTDTGITDFESTFFFINRNIYMHLFIFCFLGFPEDDQSLKFKNCVACIGNRFPQKYIFI
ncbi:hypothetical protein UUC_18270 [Rhodanobacter denitrificans]|nr:hypothetical protein UUC_18270 [Rhodanobacter denitrificans]